MLVEVARKKVYEYNPGAAVKLVMDCLEGCTKEQAFKIITGEYRLVAVKDGVDIEEATPDFDVKEWVDDSVTYLEDKGEGLMEDLKAVMKQIITKGKTDMVEVNYDSLFNYYFNNDPNGIVNDVETSGKLPDLVRSLCLDCRKFLENCHEIFITLSYLKNNHDIEIDPGKVLFVCTEMNKFVQELCTDSSDVVNQMYARQQYMKAELDKYIKEGKTIDELREKNVIHPVDITSDTDAGWLSPNGDYYGLKGAVANFLHIQIADDTIYDYHQRGYTYDYVIGLLRKAKEIGFILCLYTVEPDPNKLQWKIDYCTNLGIEPDYVNKSPVMMRTSKPFFNILLDDRAGLYGSYLALKEIIDYANSKSNKS